MNIDRTINSILFLVLVAGITATGCITRKAQKIPDQSFTIISFGKTGGVTNIPDSYAMTAEGSISRLGKEAPVVIGQASRSMLKKIKRMILETNFMSTDLRETGNMTYFIEIDTPSGTHGVTWAQSTEAPGIKELYQALTETIK
jgi:hypothetical protein